jgi:glycosyltransferase involved in cell wall biosynthesis
MGLTPTAPLWLRRLDTPDIAHVLGFRDPLGAIVGAWCRHRRIPYVLQPLGMLMPQLRKVRLKGLIDRTVLGPLTAGAAAIVVTSEQEREQVLSTGVDAGRVVVRRIGFPGAAPAPGELRRALGLDKEKLVLYVGRLAVGKGIELLLTAARELPGVHVALVGPDAGHGVDRAVEAARRDPATAGRIHRLEPRERPLALYADADVFVLPSAGESFGLVAAEAAAAGTAVVVTDRCGIAETFRDGGALVVPYDGAAIVEAVRRILEDDEFRARLASEARSVAATHSWDAAVERQETIYREAIARAR